ncbi:hypothetical protein [Mycoplasmopsis bovirhinis]|uniref:hypothetical protein n=1 Tax=Mycoplasmopsis bovirhinis TaxID=29553 RepID=UPI000E7388A9|nr:hypothetical protein [Mycoplasmopsis bovirhinis]
MSYNSRKFELDNNDFFNLPLLPQNGKTPCNEYTGKQTNIIQMGLGYSLANYEAPGGECG